MTDATIQEAQIAAATTRYRRFNVDLWATNLNDVELGIMKHTQHRAKSDQFTTDMDVIGQITEDGQRTGLLAYRKGLWREEAGAKKRLVVKLFSETMNWRGTLDMMIGRSVQLTHAADDEPNPAFAINLPRHDQIIQLERSASTFSLLPERYSFFILKDSSPRYYWLRQNLISIGRDYSILDERGRKVGLLDGKLMSFGGMWRVKLRSEHDDPRLRAALQLFCAMLRFKGEARRHIRALSRGLRKGADPLQLDRFERELYYNPRMR